MILAMCDVSPACLFDAHNECTDPSCLDHCHGRTATPPADTRLLTRAGWRARPATAAAAAVPVGAR